MLKLDQQELIIQRIQSKKTIFKTEGEIEQYPKLIKNREAIQRQILSQIQRAVPIPDMNPLSYGQKELKDVIAQMEEQLKTMPIQQQSLEEKKKLKFLTKQDQKQDYDHSNHDKKQRVDKNKCRKCRLSTIPTILNLLKQPESQDPNPHVTMKSIRQQIVQKSQKKEEQSESKVPYIAFDYSDRIIICKRCRFKFHAECVSIVDNINDWICDYCQDRIQELKSSNQWDYKNNKQLKQSICQPSDQKKQQLSLIERIQKKQKIFIIEEMQISPFKPIDQIAEFLIKYPLYKGINNKIKYPVLESLALDYSEVLEIKNKPQPYMINSKMVEEILKIQTVSQIMFPSSLIPTNVNQEYIEKNFYEILLNLIKEYINEIILKDDQKFERYYYQANAYSASYLVIMNYLFYNQENIAQDLLKKTWIECVQQIDQVINYQTESPINKIDFQKLEFQDQIYILSILTEGLYEIESMKDQIKSKDTSQNQRSSHLRVLFQQNQSIFINCGTYLGKDAEEQSYFYFTHVPSSIFVETSNGWGQYTLSDLQELMNSLNTQGINELNLYNNLELISQIKLFDNTTPIKPHSRLLQKQQYHLDIIEVIDQFLTTEETFTKFLQKRKLQWYDQNERNQFLNLLKNDKQVLILVQSLQKFFKGLILLKSNDGHKVKPFKIFKKNFELANQVAIYIDNAQSLENVYISLFVLNVMLEEYQQYKQEKEQKQNKVNKKINLKQQKKEEIRKEELKKEELKKEEIKINKRKQKLKHIEDDSSEQEQSIQQSLANKREKRENAGKNPNINFDQQIRNQRKTFCTSCKKLISGQNNVQQCSRCNKQFHSDCLQPRKDYCRGCVRNNNNNKQK